MRGKLISSRPGPPCANHSSDVPESLSILSQRGDRGVWATNAWINYGLVQKDQAGVTAWLPRHQCPPPAEFIKPKHQPRILANIANRRVACLSHERCGQSFVLQQPCTRVLTASTRPHEGLSATPRPPCRGVEVSGQAIQDVMHRSGSVLSPLSSRPAHLVPSG
jgi:hypothetical protein